MPQIVCVESGHRLVVRVPKTGESYVQVRTTSGIGLLLMVTRTGSATTAECQTLGLEFFTAAKTLACLHGRGVTIRSRVGAVSRAFVATVNGNSVEIVIDQTDAQALSMLHTFEGSSSAQQRATLPDILRRYDNVVTLWTHHPTDADLSTIVGCFS